MSKRGNAEFRFALLLSKAGVVYKSQYLVQTRAGSRYIDFYIPNLNLAVEIDENHHELQKAADLAREDLIKSVMPNIEFLRVRDDDLNTGLNNILSRY